MKKKRFLFLNLSSLFDVLADLCLFVSVSFATDLNDFFKISCGKCVMSKCSVVRARYIILFLL